MDTKVGLQRAQAIAILRRNTIGRVGFSDHDRAVILPVSYAWDEVEEGILFRSARGSKLATANNEIGPVAFEVDEVDAGEGCIQAVVVRGRMEPVLNAVEQARLERQLDLTPWVDSHRRETWIRIVPDSVEAWSHGS